MKLYVDIKCTQYGTYIVLSLVTLIGMISQTTMIMINLPLKSTGNNDETTRRWNVNFVHSRLKVKTDVKCKGRFRLLLGHLKNMFHSFSGGGPTSFSGIYLDKKLFYEDIITVL